MYVLRACVSTYHMCSWVPADPEKGIKYPDTGGKDSWELSLLRCSTRAVSPALLLSLLPAASPVPFLFEVPTTLVVSTV